MSILPRPRRAFWADLRFVLGLVLIAASIAGVWAVVSAADATAPVLRAARTIVQGEVVTLDDLHVVEANLGALTEDYVSPTTLREGVVATRTIGDGELVPRSALADAETRRTTTVVVASSTGVPQDVDAGTVVELWETPAPAEDGTVGPPRVLVGDAIVHALVAEDAVLAGGPTGVELVIDRGAVTDVLAAVAGGSSLSIVPLGSAR